MKKRRVSRINGSLSSNAAAIAAARAAAGVRARNGGGSASAPPTDRHLSSSTPCSNVAAAIAREIFPSAAAEDSSPSSALSSPAEIDGEGDSDGIGKRPASASASTSANNSKNKNDEKASAADEAAEEQPLLGRMIQNYLVEERRRARRGATTTPPGEAAMTASAAKKKKSKKKKKKKKAGDGGAIASAASFASAASASSEGAEVNVQDECLLPSSSSLAEAASPGNAAAALPPPSPPPPPSPASGLDLLLDEMMDSREGSEIIERKGRDLESFAAFLRRRLDDHIEERRSQQQKRGKSATGKDSGDDADETDGRGDGAPENPVRRNETRLRGLEYAAVLPTVSMDEAHRQASAAECRMCRTAASTRLKNLLCTGGKFLSFESAEEWEREEKLEGPRCQMPLMVGGTPTIVLDESSARIFRSEEGTSRGNGAGGSADPAVNKEEGAERTLSLPISSRFVDELEHAFDYIAMEDVDLEAGEGGRGAGLFLEEVAEGGGKAGRGVEEVEGEGGSNAEASLTEVPAPSPPPSESRIFVLELSPVTMGSMSDTHLQIAAVCIEGEEGGESVVQKYPMEMQDIVGLVRHVLLPCGLERLGGETYGDAAGDGGEAQPQDNGGPALGDDELAAIGRRAINAINATQRKVYNLRETIKALGDKAEAARASNVRSSFDAKTAKMLTEIDAACGEQLRELGDLLLRLVKSACFVGMSPDHGFSLLQYVLGILQRYQEALTRLVGPALKQRSWMVATAGGGSIPQLYTSRAARDVHLDLVSDKVRELRSLVGDVEAGLDGGGRSVSKPSPVAKLCVLEAYRQHMEYPGVTTAADDNVFPSEEGEAMFRRLIQAQIFLAQEAAGGGLVDTVKDRERERRNEVVVLCKQMRRVVIAAEEAATGVDAVDFLGRSYKKFESTWYDVEKMSSDHAAKAPARRDCLNGGGDAEYETEDACLLLQKATMLVSQWIVLLTARQCRESSIKSLTLPPPLQRWLGGVNGIKVPQFMPSNTANTGQRQESCAGEGGERRVSSILAALLYRWLEARCSEWHAELTREELLQSMDLEEPVAKVEGGNMAGKKKKKKSKKKSGGKGKGKADKNNSHAPDESDSEFPFLNVNNSQNLEVVTEEKKTDTADKGSIGGKSMEETDRILHVEELGPDLVSVEGGGAMMLPETESKRSISGIGGANGGRNEDVESHLLTNGAAKEVSNSSKPGVTEHQAVSADTREEKAKGDTVEGGSSDERQSIASNGRLCIGTESDGGSEPDEGSSSSSAEGTAADKLSSEQPLQTDLNQMGESSSEMPGEAKHEYCPTVGVFDGSQVMSAEMYLVGRLELIWGSKGTFSGKKQVPVVWM